MIWSHDVHFRWLWSGVVVVDCAMPSSRERIARLLPSQRNELSKK